MGTRRRSVKIIILCRLSVIAELQRAMRASEAPQVRNSSKRMKPRNFDSDVNVRASVRTNSEGG